MIFKNEAKDFVDLSDISEVLNDTDADVNARKIIWPDGKRLTINQSAKKIQDQTGIDLRFVKGTITEWLQMEFEPKDLDNKQMDAFENKINDWIKDYENGVSK